VLHVKIWPVNWEKKVRLYYVLLRQPRNSVRNVFEIQMPTKDYMSSLPREASLGILRVTWCFLWMACTVSETAMLQPEHL
jgi:hypothetical protein